MKTEKPTVQSVSCDIARRIPAMQTDSSLNNEQVIAGIIEPLLEQEDAEASETIATLIGLIVGALAGAIAVAVIIAVVCLIN